MNLDDLSAETRRRVGTWLALWAGMVLLLVLIGGATRLTESGLSITEWKPVTGVLPPLDKAAWEAQLKARAERGQNEYARTAAKPQ